MREPHHGDGKGKPIEIRTQCPICAGFGEHCVCRKPIEIKHERTLREILARHMLMPDRSDPTPVEVELLALIRAREEMTRERCAKIDLRPFIFERRHGMPIMDPGEAIDVYRKAIDAMPLPCEENAP